MNKTKDLDVRAALRALKAARMAKTAELAPLVGVKPNSLNNFLRGRVSMPLDRVALLARALGARLVVEQDD